MHKRPRLKNPVELSKKLYADHRVKKERAAKKISESEEMELGKYTFSPVIHEVDKSVFLKAKEDTIVENYIKRKAKSKERKEKVDEMVKKVRMKIY